MKSYGKLSNAKSITLLLTRVRDGDRNAESELIPLVYNQLRFLAARQMAGERRDHTLRPTALVHEAYLRMFRRVGSIDVKSREHFFALAANVMRRILVDHARAHRADKRGGHLHRVEIEDVEIGSVPGNVDVLALDQALARLEQISPRSSSLVTLHYFGGLTIEEAATVLGISGRTAKREWSAVRTWLHKEIYGEAAALGSDM